MGIKKRFIEISGSAGEKADAHLLKRCHAAVREITRLILRRGGGLVSTLGADPRLDPGDPDTGRVFYWTILSEVAAFLRVAEQSGQTSSETLVKVVCSRKTLSEAIPPARRALWDELLASNRVQIQRLNVDWTGGAYIRQQQARAGDAVVLLGGGEGVEHMAALYVERGRPVIPLDPEIGGYSNDGRGGATMLHRLACSTPERFILDRRHASALPTTLQQFSLQRPDLDPSEVARRIVDFLDRVIVSRAFFIRLLNDHLPEYRDVEQFFVNVVTPCVRELGYEEEQIGLNPATDAFINREIFERIHHVDVVVADLTTARPNVFLELGYAMGRPVRTFLTAMTPTLPPFDVATMPVHFWKPDQLDADRRRLFLEAWARYAERPPLVQPREIG